MNEHIHLTDVIRFQTITEHRGSALQETASKRNKDARSRIANYPVYTISIWAALYLHRDQRSQSGYISQQGILRRKCIKRMSKATFRSSVYASFYRTPSHMECRRMYSESRASAGGTYSTFSSSVTPWSSASRLRKAGG